MRDMLTQIQKSDGEGETLDTYNAKVGLSLRRCQFLDDIVFQRISVTDANFEQTPMNTMTDSEFETTDTDTQKQEINEKEETPDKKVLFPTKGVRDRK
jgi:protein involved in sex pheromone biosynthesis